MRLRCALTLLLVMALASSALSFVPMVTEAGIDPGSGADDEIHVEFRNVSIEENTTKDVTFLLTNNMNDTIKNLTLTIEIYRWALLDEEKDIAEMTTPVPNFAINETGLGLIGTILELNRTDLLENHDWEESFFIKAPEGVKYGYYRISLNLEFIHRETPMTARSMGHFTPEEWAAGTKPPGVNYSLAEGGVEVAPHGFNYLKQPNRVPDFGNFTTPVIRPGDSGTYNFTVTNRYDMTMKDVTLWVEVYMWATIEEAKAVERVKGPTLRYDGQSGSYVEVGLGVIAPGATKDVRITISTRDDTTKGTYFMRHRIEFTYKDLNRSINNTFEMKSRGHFTSDQWEGFDYSNLYYQLGVSGIIPDSSFSVKDPVPLWPLATLIGLCVLFGALAVVFYLAEEHGEQYPRLKKALQYWSGKLEQRRRLLKQRLDELRREVDVPLEDDET